MDELLDGELVTLAAAIARGEVTSAAVTRACLDRIEKVNPALNAVVLSQPEQAMKHAEKADKAREAGTITGPLHGVPMTIKDSLDTGDMVTTWGTEGRKDFRPGRDATCVARLREAGAILMGKTNTPEFTLWFQTDNTVYGRTSNPFDTHRTAGGSSGGAAAIIAAGGSPFDIGTDTAGSIRLPAHFSGVCGLKPTTGRVPCTGNALPSSGLIAPLSQPGPMARHVNDLGHILSIIAGPDNLDPHAVLAPLHDPATVDISTLSIAYYDDNGIKTPDPAIRDTIAQVVSLLTDEGPGATEARPSGLEMAGFILGRLFSADDGDMIELLLEDARTTAPSPKIQESLSRAPRNFSGREFAQLISLWHNYQSSMLGFFEDFDVLITPVNAHTAILHGQQEEAEAYTYTSAYNLAGWPGCVVRAGTDANGLPVGVQVLARPFREDQCLAVAGWLESKLGEFPLPAVHYTH